MELSTPTNVVSLHFSFITSALCLTKAQLYGQIILAVESQEEEQTGLSWPKF